MAEEIDVEILITLVESRPVLWDKTLGTYKNKILTRNAWKDLCETLDPEFKNMNDEDKNKFSKEVTKKWSNIRDSYMKSKKKIKEATKSGANASHLKKYVYNDQLQFLQKITKGRSTGDRFSDMKDLTDDQFEQNDTFKKPCHRNLRRTTRNKIDHADEALENSKDFELPEELGGSEDDNGGEEKQDSTLKSPKKLSKRRKTDKVDEAEKRMDEVYNYFKMMTQNSEQDDCSLYTALLCKKLRTLKESTREKAMLEIDRYIYNLKQKDLLEQPSPSLQYSTQSNLSPNYQPAYSEQSPPNLQFIAQPKLSPYSQHSSESNPSSGYDLVYASKLSPNSQ